MPDQKSIDEARKFNADLDSARETTGFVDHALYSRFVGAQIYGAASTIGWIEARMEVLLTRVRQGKPLSLYSLSSRDQKEIRTELEFRAWLRKAFPGVDI